MTHLSYIAEDIFSITLLCVVIPLIALHFSFTQKNKMTLMLCTAIIMFAHISALLLWNEFYPFALGGDDTAYYQYATTAEVFDRGLQVVTHAQPGYPLLLQFQNFAANNSLLVLKSFNLLFLFIAAIIWYYIIGHFYNKTWQVCAYFSVLLCAPLWPYYMYLLKDMSITMLFSACIAFAINFLVYKRAISIMLFVVCCFILSLFRIQFVPVCTAILIVPLILSSSHSVSVKCALGALVCIPMLYVFSDKSLLMMMGIEHTRALSADFLSNVQETTDYKYGFEQMSFVRKAYSFFSNDTSFLWDPRMPLQHRIFSLSFAPWIFIFLPVFFCGCVFLIRLYFEDAANHSRHVIAAIAVVIGVFFVATLLTGMQPRWRLPVFPAMAAVAGIGWQGLMEGPTPLLRYFVPAWIACAVVYALTRPHY